MHFCSYFSSFFSIRTYAEVHYSPRKLHVAPARPRQPQSIPPLVEPQEVLSSGQSSLDWIIARYHLETPTSALRSMEWTSSVPRSPSSNGNLIRVSCGCIRAVSVLLKGFFARQKLLLYYNVCRREYCLPAAFTQAKQACFHGNHS